MKIIPMKPTKIFGSLLFLFIIFSLTSCSKKEKARVELKIENAEKSVSYLVELGSTKEKIIDSLRFSRSGQARYKFPIRVPGYYQIRFANKQTLTLILSPGEKVQITADYDNIYNSKNITGSENTMRVNVLHDSLRNTISRLNNLKKEYTELNETSDLKKMEEIASEYNKTLEGYKRFSKGFILNDLNSLANIAALFQEYEPGYFIFGEGRDLQFFKLVSDSLGKHYPNVKYVKVLNENYKAMYDSYQAQKIMHLSKTADNTLPDIYLPDKNGNTIKLSSLRGKVVLLSFWSIMNEDCNQLNRNMLSVYNKFKGKGFEIYQVSIDNSRNNWLKTIKFEEIPWISVSDTSFVNSNNRWAYNITTLPQNYLISKDQKEILGKNLNSERLESQLKQVLK